ncbi:MAG: MATE family efflux transporter [Clostridia bacterium]
MIVFNAIILKLEGNTGVAALRCSGQYIACDCCGSLRVLHQGVQPLISTFYGGGNDKQARTVLRYAMTTMLTISCAVYLLIFVFARPITTVFNSENNTELQRIAVQGLKLYFLSVVFVGYNSILATFFTSIEKALPAHILSVLRGLILIIPIAFFLSALWEMTGVWLTYPITEFLVALLGFIMYQH